MLHNVALCCIMLNCVAYCCIALHTVALCCILLHYVAYCCPVLYRGLSAGESRREGTGQVQWHFGLCEGEPEEEAVAISRLQGQWKIY